MTVELMLKASKETKGTYVYTMITSGGIEVGSVYLPKLLFEAKPEATLNMIISEDKK